jgi:hypothetical protein
VSLAPPGREGNRGETRAAAIRPSAAGGALRARVGPGGGPLARPCRAPPPGPLGPGLRPGAVPSPFWLVISSPPRRARPAGTAHLGAGAQPSCPPFLRGAWPLRAWNLTRKIDGTAHSFSRRLHNLFIVNVVSVVHSVNHSSLAYTDLCVCVCSFTCLCPFGSVRLDLLA